MEALSIYKRSYGVELNDVDFNRKLKLSALFGYLQDAANLHADNLNVGFDSVTSKFGVTWVLTGIRVVLIRIPVLHEQITIETWPQGPKKLEFERDFLVRDKEDKVVARATSTWVVLDLKTRRLAKVGSIITNFPEIKEERALSTSLKKLRSSDNLTSVYKKVIAYSDIDVNGHLNNTKYVDYIMDCFSVENHRKYNVKAIELSYINEALPGDTIQLYKDTSYLSSNQVYIEGSKENDGKIVFRALVNFRQTFNCVD